MEALFTVIARSMGIEALQVEAVMTLLREGSSVSFIARYRKERTKGLDEEQIREIEEAYQYQTHLEKRKEDVLRLIDQQGMLDEALREAICACEKLSQVEDLYRPYQQKRKTRATMAIAKGLRPLAEWMLRLPAKGDLRREAAAFVGEQVKDETEAIAGAKDIIAEMVSDDARVREVIRTSMQKYGRIVTKAKKQHTDERHIYQMYYDHSERIDRVQPHRIMAIDRGEKEKVLQVSISFNEAYVEQWVLRRFLKNRATCVQEELTAAIRDGLSRLAIPSVEREVRATLSERAQEASIDVFSMNVERLLTQPPIKDRWVLGFDPAFRTGCKLAVIDPMGTLKEISVIYPHPPKARVREAQQELLRLLRTYPITIIAIGNGTASRESEAFVAHLIRKEKLSVSFALVSEAGASVYSASPLARKEFPELQVEQRSAISIARRIIDPLAELIKIDPQSLGVGQYQHDLPPARLKERLDFVVTKAVNRVGVNVNTASAELLKHVSGLNATTAQNILDYRQAHGSITSRAQLRQIPKIGAKSFEQAAGFLRIADGVEFLDRTGIHPESYPLARQVLQALGLQTDQMGSTDARAAVAAVDADALCERMHGDPYTIRDILDAIAAPLQDYRDQFEPVLLKSDVLELSDLHVGDELQGTVRNVVDFGAFVDIGLHEDGLVHISRLSRKRVARAGDVVSIGDIVTVWVCQIDEQRQKVQLSMVPPR